jgi:hypothetical protein
MHYTDHILGVEELEIGVALMVVDSMMAMVA